ncbi:hypothetical protein F2Q69_00040708 [Brassica cretica]|uniref:Uncharacterized protein n=1 Tax=Brassica cretica TaxID=69181 RepID=A0A8S9NF86_BRACR|nr:hypothetical protein F2Q69_00040708 [Brassica cretica]
MDRSGQKKMAGRPIRVCNGGRESVCPSARSSGSFHDQFESGDPGMRSAWFCGVWRLWLIPRNCLSKSLLRLFASPRETDQNSDRFSAFCTGYGIEPSVDGSVMTRPSVDGSMMTGPRLVLDGGKVLLTGYGAVKPSVY